MSEVKVNKISPRSGTAITLGDSGDTFTIPSGATLAIAGSVTGFTSAGIDDNATSVAITINSSEQVGIGTTSFDQDAKLTIASSGSGGANPSSISANTIATFRRTGGTSHVANISVLSGSSGASILNLGDRDDEDVGNIIYEHSSNYMAFTTGASERMRIESSGNVGIGTSSVQGKLHIMKNDAGALIDGNADTLFLENTSSTGLTIGSATTGEGAIHFSDSDDSDVGKIQYAHSSNLMTFRTNGANRMFIDSSGRVGIGTSSPTRNLQIQSSASTIVSINSGNSSESQLFFADTDDDNIGRIAYDHSTNAMEFWTNDTETMRIDTNSNMLFGSSINFDSSKLFVAGVKALSGGIPQQGINVADTTAIATGVGGAIMFSGKYSGDNITCFGSIEGSKENGTSGQYGGELVFKTRQHGGNNFERMRITTDGKILLNRTSTAENTIMDIKHVSYGLVLDATQHQVQNIM